MKTLSPSLRRQLERAVVDAREVAEGGARVALEALAVHHHEPYGHMGSEERALRRRLRAHGRQIGDRREARFGNQAIDHLVHECAYEYWHGMLFSRFLAENHLLIEPETGVAISLEECEELGKEEGADQWTMAACFAHRMLPQVFRPDHPAFEVRLAREHQLKLERLVEGLPAEVFAATDSLGWVYQFWQTRKKDEINRSEVKIGADELPAVTQLFTEPYMVQFLLDNTLGAWWAVRRLGETDLQEADTEADLRRKAAISGVPLDYLRFVRREEDTAERSGWRLAAGAFNNWPEHLGDLKVLDPCCGSGHFLVAAFSMLVPMRMEREGLAARTAVDAVLRENLHGLELDPRCVALAAFALARAAWTYPGAEGYRPLPELHLACSGLAPNAAREEWTALSEQAADAGGMPAKRDLFGVDDSLLSAPLRNSLDSLYDLFAQAPELGSLIDPSTLKGDLFQSGFESVRALFAAVLERERTSDEQTERAVTARGMARAAELLIGRYHWVITNVPYLARGKQGESLRGFCERHYPDSKNDLATVFLERCLELCAGGGTASLVLPQNWLFLTSYRKLRAKLLRSETWHLFARLGPKGFQTPMWDFNVQLLTLSRGNPRQHKGRRFSEAAATGMMYGLDVSEFRTAGEKAVRLREAVVKGVEQAQQLQNPDATIALRVASEKGYVRDFADCFQGLTTGDDPRLKRQFWELGPTRSDSETWTRLQGPSKGSGLFGGRKHLVDARIPKGELEQGALRGREAWGKRGIAIDRVRSLSPALYCGDYYHSLIPVLVPRKDSHLIAFAVFALSNELRNAARDANQSLSIDNGYFEKFEFDVDQWMQVGRELFPNGLPRPYSDDPTQWIFHGHPYGSVVWDEVEKRTAHGPLRTDPTVLQVAVARLLGYRWPAEQDAGMELADEQHAWVRNCATLRAWADEDGIVCIPSVRGEPPASERLLRLLAAAFGEAWNDGVLTRLLAEAGSPTLDDWLRNRFFDEHCKLFHHRPFVWHLWDGRRRDGFHALVSYHKLAEADGKGRRLLESLTYSYLGDWVARQRDGVKRGEGGAEDRLAAALELQKRLIAILEGKPPFDIFVRWKRLKEQPIGWEPDINDGVRLNIRPFMAEDIPGGKKGAGILRAKPNIHWRKDRGKEPLTRGNRSKPPWIEDEDWDPDDDQELRPKEEFPWFWNSGEFTGERVNHVHLTIPEKRTARDRAGSKS